jgi:hypothetical protein
MNVIAQFAACSDVIVWSGTRLSRYVLRVVSIGLVVLGHWLAAVVLVRSRLAERSCHRRRMPKSCRRAG